MSAQKLRANEKMCPLIENIFEDCYGSSMDSNNIEKITFYCMGIYKSCEIYRSKYPYKSVKKSATHVEIVT